MMSGDEGLDLIVNIVALNGGRLVGRTRFQKTAYLLEKLGAEIPFDFDYHYYGPYSAELSEVLNVAVETKQLNEELGVGYHGTTYSIFGTNKEASEYVAGMRSEIVGKWLKTLAGYTGTDLELAATILYLRDERHIPEANFDEELVGLKPVKATPEGVARARHLLNDLSLFTARTGHLSASQRLYAEA